MITKNAQKNYRKRLRQKKKINFDLLKIEIIITLRRGSNKTSIRSLQMYLMKALKRWVYVTGSFHHVTFVFN